MQSIRGRLLALLAALLFAVACSQTPGAATPRTDTSPAVSSPDASESGGMESPDESEDAEESEDASSSP
jgi:hypothetical protein